MGSHRLGHDWGNLAAAATMVIEVTDYKDVFLAVTKRNISILIVDKLNTAGIWHLTFQPEEETMYNFLLAD